jgi:hypothetical protein
MAHLSLPDEIWTRVRMRALKDGTSATKIVEAALLQWFEKLDRAEPDKARRREGLAAEPDPIVKFKEARLDEVSVTKDEMPWGPSSVIPDAVIPAIEKKLRGEPAIALDALPPPAVVSIANGESATITSEMHIPAEGSATITDVRVIKDPKEAGAAVRAVAAGREFHPVPKPVRKPRPKR